MVFGLTQPGVECLYFYNIFLVKKNTVKLVYIKITEREREHVACISSCPSIDRLKLFELFINRKNETVLYRQ